MTCKLCRWWTRDMMDLDNWGRCTSWLATKQIREWDGFTKSNYGCRWFKPAEEVKE